MIEIAEYVSSWKNTDTGMPDAAPWIITSGASDIVGRMISLLDDSYRIAGDVAIHRSAEVEAGSIIKGPVVIGPGCHVAATAYVRGWGVHGKKLHCWSRLRTQIDFHV